VRQKKVRMLNHESVVYEGYPEKEYDEQWR